MYTADELKQMVFIDVETTTQTETLQELIDQNPKLEEYWNLKAMQYRESKPEEMVDFSDPNDMWPRMAGLWPEWGKIVCISIGQLKFDDYGMPLKFSSTSYYGHNEKKILEQFTDIAGKIMSKYPKMQWVGHNIKGFDMPYIVKRCLVNGVSIPKDFHFQKQKPWENCLLDTMEIWKFGGYNTAKLGLIAEILGIPSPKDAMSGPEVNEYYWSGRLEEIKTYCEKDVKATADVMLKISGMPPLYEAPF
jgi:hypothetical protein